MMHIDYSVAEDYLNPFDSYGEICTRCNSCGRFSKDTMYQDRLVVYKRHLQEQYEFNDWCEGWEEIQRANREKNIEYYQRLIKETEDAIANVGDSHE